MAKKYYWLKLKNDFFKRHDVRIVESMPNGKDYILFYLKLLVESVSHDGHLRFNETIPYSEEMLATITNTNIDIVRSAIKIFTELNLMEKLDDDTIYMIEVEKMTGAETEWAEKKRLYRENKKKQDLLVDNVLNEKDNVRQEIELEKEKELELDNNATKLFKFYEQEIGMASPTILIDLNTWLEHFDEDIIEEAIKRASMANARNYNYVKSVLTNWLNEGVSCFADTQKGKKKKGKVQKVESKGAYID